MGYCIRFGVPPTSYVVSFLYQCLLVMSCGQILDFK